MIEVSGLAPSDQDEYAAFVASRPDARFTHDLRWARALWDAYGLPCEQLVARRSGRVVGAMPLFKSRSLLLGRHLSSCPFPTYAPPLFDNIETLTALLRGVADRTSALRYAHIFCGDPLPEDKLTLKLERRSYDLTFRLPLEADPALVFARLSENVRRATRLAERAGVKIVLAPEGAASSEFYRLYANVNATRYGWPPHPRSLFQSLARHFGPSAARVHLAYVDGTCLAAILTLRSHCEVSYVWTGSSPAGRKLQATTLTLFRIIEEACFEGYSIFSLGEAPKGHASLVNFKKRWCPNVSETVSYYLLGSAIKPPPHFYNGFGWQKKIIATLPTVITTRVIPPLLRYVV